MGTRKDTIEYIGQITVCLASLARADGLATLAHMLDMAALEANHEIPPTNGHGPHPPAQPASAEPQHRN
jgi:hypothetical protein